MTEPVVVGVSSFDTRLPMVRWAADEAVRRGAGLRLVAAHAPERGDREAASRRLAEMAAAVAGLPGLRTRTETVVGPPAAVLRAAAEDAALLVVGADDASPCTEAIAGSVPGDLLTTAPCPLVVAPRRGWTTPASAPVVAAIDATTTATPRTRSSRCPGPRRSSCSTPAAGDGSRPGSSARCGGH